MTGYGKAEGPIGPLKFTVELRSLNSKGLDLSVRMPSAYREKEMPLRKALAAQVGRGKCELAIHYEANAAVSRHEITAPLIAQYVTQIRAIAREAGLPEDGALNAALKFPDAVSTPRESLDPEVWTALEALISEATERFNAFRSQEGDTMAQDFRERIETIGRLQDELRPFIDARSDRVRKRIRENLEEAVDLTRIDENRFEQELLFYLEKLDVTEEQVRLKAHLAYFLEMLGQGEKQGKKLGFIAQEIGREINTLGSKANDAEMQRHVVQMKDELEKIKEQVLNVL
jgi:uncharacterized protein (TIGR00255 family)